MEAFASIAAWVMHEEAGFVCKLLGGSTDGERSVIDKNNDERRSHWMPGKVSRMWRIDQE
ncbi:hypothetical protein NNRS527_01836 [Nitrosospira sp. NRS527]|nr:hypothetical protein NNRS527_01836 [Nitrosospira sp. NRS527]